METESKTATHAPRRKPRGHGHERRGEILAAARRMFVLEGYENVTTRKLADQVGISQTGLYVYFENKEAILKVLCRDAFDGLVARMRAAAAGTPLGPERLHALVEAYVDFGFAFPDEYQLVFMTNSAGTPYAQPKDLSLPFDEQPPGLQAFLACRDQVADLIRAGVLRRMDESLATQMIWMSCHGLVALLITRPNFPWADRKTLVDELASTLAGGLLRSSGRRP